VAENAWIIAALTEVSKDADTEDAAYRPHPSPQKIGKDLTRSWKRHSHGRFESLADPTGELQRGKPLLARHSRPAPRLDRAQEVLELALERLLLVDH
jgi:hypothetical protein